LLFAISIISLDQLIAGLVDFFIMDSYGLIDLL